MIRSAQACVGRPVRRGTVVPLLALTIVALVGFLALAIDLGMLAVAKAQAQQAADLAALTAARTVNGNAAYNYNQTAATTNAQNILAHNAILGQSIQSSQLQLTYGSYDYSQTTQTFNANYPATAGSPYTAVAATVTASSLPGAFSTIFGQQFLPSRHGHCPGGPPPARRGPGDGPFRFDAHGHLPRLRLSYHLAHHQQSRHSRPDVRPIFVEQCCYDRADRQPNFRLR